MVEEQVKNPPERILIVEDDPGISSMLIEILTEEGYGVTHADDGEVAVTLLGTFAPDLVLLDLQIPHKTGFDILKEIRQKDHGYGIFIPVIVLTGVYTSREDKVVSLDAGADDFLAKPFDILELLARVRSLLRIRELYKRSQYLATHDHLTRCYNRRFLLDFLNREVERYKRYKKPFSYLLLDLDHFKQVNDIHGHEVGDQVLVNVGFCLQDFFRAVDCVSRLGGDEFAVVLPDTTIKDAPEVGDRLMRFLPTIKKRGSFPPKVADKIGFSVGISTFPDHSNDRENLMRIADEAMYTSKKQGRNRWSVAPLDSEK